MADIFTRERVDIQISEFFGSMKEITDNVYTVRDNFTNLMTAIKERDEHIAAQSRRIAKLSSDAIRRMNELTTVRDDADAMDEQIKLQSTLIEQLRVECDSLRASNVDLQMRYEDHKVFCDDFPTPVSDAVIDVFNQVRTWMCGQCNRTLQEFIDDDGCCCESCLDVKTAMRVVEAASAGEPA